MVIVVFSIFPINWLGIFIYLVLQFMYTGGRRIFLTLVVMDSQSSDGKSEEALERLNKLLGSIGLLSFVKERRLFGALSDLLRVNQISEKEVIQKEIEEDRKQEIII